MTAIPARSYRGRVSDYAMVSGYDTRGGLQTEFGVSTFSSGPNRKQALINVKFGDGEVGPGETVGRFTDHGSYISVAVRLPRAEARTFWRAIRDFRNPDQECFLEMVWNADNDIIAFAAVVLEEFEGGADKDQRERIDARRHQVIDSWRRGLGVAGDSY